MTAPETLAERLAKCVNPLEWTDPAPPDAECSYDHVFAPSIFGRYSIEWKSWKEREGYTVQTDAFFVGAYDTLEAAKAAAQADYTARILAALDMDAIARLVAEAVEKEREGCAQVAASLCVPKDGEDTYGQYSDGREAAGYAIAAAIRARADRQTEKEG